MAKFTASKSETKTQLPEKTSLDKNIYEQLGRIGDQQAGNLSSQIGLQRLMLNPHQALLDLQKPFQAPTQAEAQAHMLKTFGQDWMNKFNAGGGTGQGVDTATFDRYRAEAEKLNRDPLEGLRTEDVRMKLQQQIAQNQGVQQAQADMLTRMQNPYGLTSQEEQQINGVYDAQQKRAMNDMNLSFQDLVTSRGMNRSDIPVVEPLARNLALLNSDLGGMRAAALLNRGDANRNFWLQLQGQYAGLQNQNFNQGLMLNQMTPAGLTTMMQPLLQERMAQARTTGTQTPSMYDSIMRGVGTAGSMVMGAYGGGMLGGGGGLGLSGAPVSNVGGGLGSYAQGGSNFLVNMPK